MSRAPLEREIEEHLAVVAALRDEIDLIRRIGERIIERLERGGKVLVMGNGGSAADSQHLAAELVGRFRRRRGGVPAIALTTDTSILTSVSNEFGYERVFTRQIEALCAPEDVAVGFSTSGRSANVVEAIRTARGRGAYTVGLTGGDAGRLRETADDCVVASSSDTARIQEAHILIAHLWCEMIDARAPVDPAEPATDAEPIRTGQAGGATTGPETA